MKAIIFDCDGTLVDSEAAHLLAWEKVLQNRGRDLTQELRNFYAGKPDKAIAVDLMRLFDFNSLESLLNEKNNYYRYFLNEGLAPILATVDFVRKLAAKKHHIGLKLAVASAALKEEVLINLRNLEIKDAFDVILSGHDDLVDYSDPEGVNKPKPYIYQHAAKLLCVQPKECVVIEDSFTGVKAAIDAGCFTIAVPNRFTKDQDFSAASLKIESFSTIDLSEFLKMIESTERI